MGDIIDFNKRLNDLKQANALKGLAEKEMLQIKKYGFYAHHVFPSGEGDKFPDNWASHHTHGLDMVFGHPNFEIQLCIAPQIAMMIFIDLAHRIATEGKVFAPGVNDGIIANHNVLLKKAICSAGDEVLRIIMPDPSGDLDRNTMDEAYKVQFLEEHPK